MGIIGTLVMLHLPSQEYGVAPFIQVFCSVSWQHFKVFFIQMFIFLSVVADDLLVSVVCDNKGLFLNHVTCCLLGSAAAPLLLCMSYHPGTRLKEQPLSGTCYSHDQV